MRLRALVNSLSDSMIDLERRAYRNEIAIEKWAERVGILGCDHDYYPTIMMPSRDRWVVMCLKCRHVLRELEEEEFHTMRIEHATAALAKLKEAE